jgi:hypothetical protein
MAILSRSDSILCVLVCIVLAFGFNAVQHDWNHYDLQRKGEWCQHRTNILSLIDEGNKYAIRHILEACPHHMTYLHNPVRRVPLLHALMVKQNEIALMIAKNPTPLWTSRQAFGVDTVHFAHQSGNQEIFNHILNHSSCVMDSHTYCNTETAMLMHSTFMRNFVRWQITKSVHASEKTLLDEVERLRNGTPEERLTVRMLCDARYDKCDGPCDYPGQCLVQSITLDYTEYNDSGEQCHNPEGLCF